MPKCWCMCIHCTQHIFRFKHLKCFKKHYCKTIYCIYLNTIRSLKCRWICMKCSMYNGISINSKECIFLRLFNHQYILQKKEFNYNYSLNNASNSSFETTSFLIRRATSFSTYSFLSDNIFLA